MALGFLISTFFLHFTQYACISPALLYKISAKDYHIAACWSTGSSHFIFLLDEASQLNLEILFSCKYSLTQCTIIKPFSSRLFKVDGFLFRLYADQISRAYEEERTRIARELHDDTIQTMVAVSRRLDSLAHKNLGIPKKLWGVLDEIQRDVDESLIRTRRFIQDLRPPTLEYLGLLPALRELVTQWQGQSDIEINLRTGGSDRHFTPEKELLIYRIVQEALRNIWKHSEATKVEVVIKLGEEMSTVTISDNGKGFNAEDSLGFLETGKLGLAGMKERAHLLGGTLTIRSVKNSGTKVILDIPGKDLVA